MEEQVLVRDHPQRAEPLGAEQPALLERLQPLVVGEQAGEEVALAVVHAAQPAEVVEPEVVEPQLVRVAVERAGDAAEEPRRRVADADDAAVEHVLDRLGDEAGRVREVDEPGAAARARATCWASSRITGTVRSAKQIPPGPVVSWPTTPSSSGTCSSTTRPSSWPTRIAQKTKSAPSSASSSCSVGRNGELLAALALEPLEHRRDLREPPLLDVVERDLLEPEPLGAREQRAVDHRHAEARRRRGSRSSCVHHLDPRRRRARRPRAPSARRR